MNRRIVSFLPENLCSAASNLSSTWTQAADAREHPPIDRHIATPVAAYGHQSDLVLPVPTLQTWMASLPKR
jgi:hypothetical protein